LAVEASSTQNKNKSKKLSTLKQVIQETSSTMTALPVPDTVTIHDLTGEWVMDKTRTTGIEEAMVSKAKPLSKSPNPVSTSKPKKNPTRMPTH
jgi:hypothetical protein